MRRQAGETSAPLKIGAFGNIFKSPKRARVCWGCLAKPKSIMAYRAGSLMPATRQ